MIELPLIDNTLFIDNTSLERFTTCPRSAEYYIIRKREKAGTGAAVNYGSAIHEALATRYFGHNTEAQHSAINNWFATHPQDGEEWRSHDLALDCINSYNKNYPSELFELLKRSDGTPMVELPFAIPLGEIASGSESSSTISVVWTGRIDALVRENNMTFVLDHKTTSMLGATYFDEYENSSQMLGYVWAAQHLLNTKVHGVIINALCSRKPTRTGKGIEFSRQRIYPDQSRISEWHTNTLTIVSDFVSHAQRDFFPQHTKWCVGKYGKCPYFEVCTLPPSQRDMMLNSPLYKDVTWNPLNK